MLEKRNFIISKDKSYVKGFTRKGEAFLFSKSDYDIVKRYTWYISKRGYVTTNVKRIATPMHKIILDNTDGFDVDHISGDKLDNRRSNLRICTHQENMFNQRLRSNNTSGFIGVSLMKNVGRYEAYIHYNSKKHHLGLYDNPVDAAIARDRAAKKYYGEFASLNFPEESDVYAIL
jgi:hypothetical protein